MIKLLVTTFFLVSPLFAYKIGLDWMLNIQHGVLIYARAQGLIPKNTEFIPHQSSSKALIQLSLSNVDLAVSYEPNIAAAQKKKLEVEPFLDMVTVPLEVFVTRFEVADLKGKRIGHQSSPGSISEKNLERILKSANLTLDDVKKVFSLYLLTQGLLAKQYDAAMHISSVFAPELLEHDKSLKIYPLTDFGITYKGQVMAVKKGNDLPDLKNGLERAKAEVLSDPSKAWEVICEDSPSLNTPSNKERFKRYVEFL